MSRVFWVDPCTSFLIERSDRTKAIVIRVLLVVVYLSLKAQIYGMKIRHFFRVNVLKIRHFFRVFLFKTECVSLGVDRKFLQRKE